MKNIIRHIKTGESLGRIILKKASKADNDLVGRERDKDHVSKEDVLRDFSDDGYIEHKLSFFKSIDIENASRKVQSRLALRKNRRIVAPFYRRIAIGTTSAAVIIAALSIWLLSERETQQLSLDSETHELLMQFVPGKASAYLGLNMKGGFDYDQQNETPLLVKVDAKTFQQLTENVKHESQYNSLTIPIGSEFNFTLPDGSHIWLNSGSEIVYFASDKTRIREIFLIKGEAYFTVAPDPERPFRIHCPGHIIEALGTEFNISAYEDSPFIYTTLVEGKVSVTVDGDSKVVEIMERPGRQSMLNRASNAISLRDVDVYSHVSWKDGYFVFNKTSLFNVMQSLSRWYGFEFDITDQKLYDYHFTGEFNRFDNLEQVLEVIRSTGLPFSISFDQGKVLVLSKSN